MLRLVLTRATRHNILEDGILHDHFRYPGLRSPTDIIPHSESYQGNLPEAVDKFADLKIMLKTSL
jgi:hypothetical protein